MAALVGFRPTEGPGVSRAASLALGVLGVAKVKTWAGLTDLINRRDPQTLRHLAGLELTGKDYKLLAKHHAALLPLALTPLTTLAVCPECKAWTLIGTGVAPASCKVTFRCPGKPAKASRAVRADISK
ncbi:MAG: hypothetical protein ACRCYU_11970 [Nocardioides sp.]